MHRCDIYDIFILYNLPFLSEFCLIITLSRPSSKAEVYFVSFYKFLSYFFRPLVLFFFFILFFPFFSLSFSSFLVFYTFSFSFICFISISLPFFLSFCSTFSSSPSSTIFFLPIPLHSITLYIFWFSSS
jgi:hypothetical protein